MPAKKGMKTGKKQSKTQDVTLAFMHSLELDTSPLDTLTVSVKNLRVIDEEPKQFLIKVTFYDQLILRGVIMAIGPRVVVKEKTLLSGTITYDPSDYERMCLMADNPLCVQIQPQGPEFSPDSMSGVTESTGSSKPSSKLDPFSKNLDDINCCNIDILSLLTDGEDNKYVQKRMEPLRKPSLLYCKSWNNLPIISMKIRVIRNKHNELHHKALKEANLITMTLISSHNMPRPYDEELMYTAASKLPMQSDDDLTVVTFIEGYRVPKHFNSLNFFPKWESLKVREESFNHGDVKFKCIIDDIRNDTETSIEAYLDNKLYSTVWGSFHRTLLLGNSVALLKKHISRYRWPLEIHMYGEGPGYSFMAFLDLFNLLYPGENTVRIAVPLLWINAEAMQQACACDLLLMAPSQNVQATGQKVANLVSPISLISSPNDLEPAVLSTGCDQNNAFVLVEIKLARPLKKAIIPPFISATEMNSMLTEMEQAEPHKRECTGRGQQDRDWQTIVKIAASALRKVPYYGMTDFCTFNRQLSETRTRVELMTSFWQDAAVYVNNNFVIQDFLQSDESFEQMLMMAHASLMNSVGTTLVGVDKWQNLDPILRGARHARQMQDFTHAMELYLQLLVKKPRDASSWRELATCLKDIDHDWANVCINKSIALDPRNPLSLLAKGGMLFEEDPALAEPFFVALLALYPYWSTGWVATSAYYFKRELFHIADQVKYYSKNLNIGAEDYGSPRTWERELGDWWDYTPILPGMSNYYDAADILLRLRCIRLAEVCVSLAVYETGETAAYYHLLALCCRLKGDLDDALCHIRTGIEKYGEITYLRSLEAECYHQKKNVSAAAVSFEKAGNCVGAFSILLSIPYREQQRARPVLVDLVRRQPSAYAWMAFSDDWLMRDEAGEFTSEITGDQAPAKTCAVVCAIQALKLDRRMTRAWTLLAKLVKPSARRQHCLDMARACGFMSTTEDHQGVETDVESQQSLCYHLGNAVMTCNAYK